MYKDKLKLCYTDTDTFIINVETEDFYKDTANDVERWFDTPNFKNVERSIAMGENKKVIGMYKDQLRGKSMREFVANRAKTYAYLTDNGEEVKKAKGVNRSVIKRRLMFEKFKDSLLNIKVIMTQQMRFKSDHHDV